MLIAQTFSLKKGIKGCRILSIFAIINEENILESSNLYGIEELPDTVNQEDLLDKKKQEREKLGSVNLKADE